MSYLLKNFSQNDPKVRDHCHHTGKYRGPAHNNCNLRYRIPSHIPIIAHNSAGYDTHLFIKELAKSFEDSGVISKNKEETLPSLLRFQSINTSIRMEKRKTNLWSLDLSIALSLWQRAWIP